MFNEYILRLKKDSKNQICFIKIKFKNAVFYRYILG